MKNHANMAAAHSTPTTLAVATLRRRNSDSGISGAGRLSVEAEGSLTVAGSIDQGTVGLRVGGNLTTILDTISNTIRERARLRRDVRVITSMQRISSYVIGMLPIGLALIIFTINPKYMSKMFQPGWTLCIPIGAVFFWLLGFIVIRKLVDIKV